MVTSPNLDPLENYLFAVSWTSASDVWAVGHYGDSIFGIHSLILHWDGNMWSAVPNPGSAALKGLTAISPTDAWATGIGLIMRWTGLVWTPVSAPGPGSNSLLGADAISADDVWAAGTSAAETRVLRYFAPCGTPSPTATVTAPPRTPTTVNGTPTGTPTPCSISFSDVRSSDYFYEAVRYLYCHGVISGYLDGTFRPYNLTTRAQLAKIVALAEGWAIYTPATPTFRDVPATHVFYQYIETAYHQGIISGYGCGPDCLEFRPDNNVTRGQLCKIVALAAGWPIYTPPAPTFQDVPTTDTFYTYVETAYHHGIISGYSCGAGCLEFRPGGNATRGQISKIVYLAVTGPARR